VRIVSFIIYHRFQASGRNPSVGMAPRTHGVAEARQSTAFGGKSKDSHHFRALPIENTRNPSDCVYRNNKENSLAWLEGRF
jgi:hypothetical protein